MSDRRLAVAALAVAVVLTAVGAAPVRAVAQIDTSVTTTTSPPVTEPPPTTTEPPPQPQPQDQPAPEPTAPAQPVDTAPAAPPDTAPPDEPPADDDEVGPALVLDNRPRTGPSSTAELLDALRPLTALGFSEEEAFVLGMGRFPVAGLVIWSDDFHDPRYNPTPHLHQGNDLWADHGVPVRSPAAGEVELTSEAVGGISVYVTTDDGTYYYMTHLDSYADDLQTGDIVEQGQVVGYNGATGNAAGGPPHVHFEIHPGGGGAVDPKPILDQWIAEAIAAAPSLYGGDVSNNPRVLLSTGELRRFDVPVMATAERAAKSPLLWSASVSSGGAALRLAEVEAARMAQRVDWGERAVRAQATAVERHLSQQRAVTLLSRLTPPALRAVLDSGA
ncbi:MAG TPA: M23 family metallopeptidase [Acidimicrobiales bacterium]